MSKETWYYIHLQTNADSTRNNLANYYKRGMSMAGKSKSDGSNRRVLFSAPGIFDRDGEKRKLPRSGANSWGDRYFQPGRFHFRSGRSEASRRKPGHGH